MYITNSVCKIVLKIYRKKTYALQKSTGVLLTAGKKNGLYVCAGTMKCMFMPYENNAGQNDKISLANRSFENVVNCSHLGTILTNQNCLHEKLKQMKFKELYKTFGRESFVIHFAT